MTRSKKIDAPLASDPRGKFRGCPQTVLVRFVISQKGLYHSAFHAEDTHAAQRLSPVSRCPRSPEPGPDRGRPVEDQGSLTEDGGNFGKRSTDKPRSRVPLLRRRAPTEVGPHPDQGPALPLHWLQKTYSGRTGSAIGRLHRPDLFMVALRDMLGTATPQSVRKLARGLGLSKYTVWHWRMLVLHHRQQPGSGLLRNRGGG